MSIGVVERDYIASLRDRVVFSLKDLRRALLQKLLPLTRDPSKKKDGSKYHCCSSRKFVRVGFMTSSGDYNFRVRILDGKQQC